MTPLDIYNDLVIGKTLKLKFDVRAEAVNYRNMLAVLHKRKKKEYIAFGLIDEDSKATIVSEIADTGNDTEVEMTLRFGERARKYGGPTSFTIVEE